MNNLSSVASSSSLGKRGFTDVVQEANYCEDADNEGVNTPTISEMPSQFLQTTNQNWVVVAQQVNALLESIQGIALGGPSILNEKGVVVEGLVKEGKIVSKGKIIVENGVYYGHFINGQLSGGQDSCLTMSPSNTVYQGVSYIGGLVNSLPNGFGILYRADRSEAYRGDWRNGVQHGQGAEISPEGGKYVGGWNMGLREGEGILYRQNNFKAYEGGWVNNLFHGKGSVFSTDGRPKVEGMFAAGKIHGEATYHYSNGGKYVGPFDHGKRHGSGMFYQADGRVFRVVMNHGTLVSRELYKEERK